MNEALPCPCCRSNAKIVDAAGGGHWIECVSCSLQTAIFEIADDAIASWNARAQQAKPVVTERMAREFLRVWGGELDDCSEEAAIPAPGQVSEDAADEIVTRLYRRFKDWNKRGFGLEDVTWCEVKADVIALCQAARMPAPVADPGGVLSSPAAKRAALEAAAHTRWRDAVPKIPNGVHQLDAPAAIDPKGCVLFFDTEAECEAFMDWLAASPRATGETGNG